MKRKGIVLAGGSGTRLYPMTRVVSKQLLPVYDKPMVFYPLSVLMLAGIREVLLISTPQDISRYEELFGDGSKYGMFISYAVQKEPKGLAEAFIIGEKFIGSSPVSLVLGDNIFYGQNLKDFLNKADKRIDGATIFGYQVNNPQDFGVLEFDERKKVLSIEEKPTHPKSNWAVTGLYYYDNRVIDIAKEIKPSSRGELEITDVNNMYLALGELFAEDFGRGFAWLDTGTPTSLIEASHFIQTLELRQGFKIACLEEIACRNGWISPEEIIKLSQSSPGGDYSNYLLKIAKEIESI
jgi:glucose-1-phosphate thymidylyltransferase